MRCKSRRCWVSSSGRTRWSYAQSCMRNCWPGQGHRAGLAGTPDRLWRGARPNLPVEIWERAGQAYGSYARRRQGSGGGLPRRLLADFVVGAHAEKTCTTLVTLDPQHYRLGFPGLNIVVP